MRIKHPLSEAKREIARKRTAAWRIENRARALAAQKRCYDAVRRDPERWSSVLKKIRIIKRKTRAQCTEYNRKWRAANPEAVRVQNARYRDARTARGTLTAKELAEQLAIQDGRCFYCARGLPKSSHAEHMTPVCRGGLNVIDNVVWSCPSCNTHKGRKTAAEFLLAEWDW